MPTHPDGIAPLAADDVPPKRRYGCIIAIIASLSVLAALAMLLPMIGAPREAARCSQCRMNLRRIGLAMNDYQQKYGCFPPAFVPDENGKPKHSWRVLILPFLGEDDLYKQYRFDEPWNGPHNKGLATQMPVVYSCPTWAHDRVLRVDSSLTSYAMIVGPHAISDGPTARRECDVKDGLENTIIVAECVGARINWLEPRDLDVGKMTFRIASPDDPQKGYLVDISTSHRGRNQHEPAVANVLLCDGSVLSLPKDIQPKLVQAMTTIDCGEPVNTEDSRNRRWPPVTRHENGGVW
jgi:hypothetical protein